MIYLMLMIGQGGLENTSAETDRFFGLYIEKCMSRRVIEFALEKWREFDLIASYEKFLKGE